jgi:hypothetical protein
VIKKPILLAYWKKARLPLSAEIPRPPEPLVQRYIFDSIRRLTGIGRFSDRPLLVDCVSSPRQLVHPLSQQSGRPPPQTVTVVNRHQSDHQVTSILQFAAQRADSIDSFAQPMTEVYH